MIHLHPRLYFIFLSADRGAQRQTRLSNYPDVFSLAGWNVVQNGAVTVKFLDPYKAGAVLAAFYKLTSRTNDQSLKFLMECLLLIDHKE